jgi:GH15 family glucan-1,4-alpha-glucosidase
MRRTARNGPTGTPSAAARIPVPIASYGVIGNMSSAALVAPDGSIDWCCLPDFAAPSVFGRLLDPARGGFFQVAPAESAAGRCAYLPRTNVLATTFENPGGPTLRVLDYMPVDRQGRAPAPGMLVRRMDADGGPIRVRVVCAPRFDYGRTAPQWDLGGTEAVGSAGTARLWLGFPEPPAVDGEGIDLEMEIVPGRARSVELAWGDRRPRVPPPEELLEATIEHWRDWTHSRRAPFHAQASERHAWVERSELVLKLLSSRDTGAFVAAVTTSLPEWPGGARNWDYRFVWVRDAAFTAGALLMLGHLPEARRFLAWVVARAVGPDIAGSLQVAYQANGDPVPDEQTLPHLPGYLGSTPVRIGNEAAHQFQLDIYGELLDAASSLFLLDREAVGRMWPRLRDQARNAEGAWTRPDAGIWEARGRPAHYVHSKVMAWVAFDRAHVLAREFEGASSAAKWARLAERVRAQILARGYDARRTTFRRAYGQSGADAANLRIPLVGFLPVDDPRVVGTVRRTEAELGPGPFLRRYLADDGVGGPEARFLACGFWLVECLARQGETERATAYFAELTRASGPLAIFSEEFDPTSGTALGNYPQGLTHIGVLRAALALGARRGAGRMTRLSRPRPPEGVSRSTPRIRDKGSYHG